jgi:hypothetical protein
MSAGGRGDRDPPIETTFEPFLTDKGKGERGDSGNYRREAARELDRFHAWCVGEAEGADGPAGGLDRPVRCSDLDDRLFREYARHLVRQGYAPGTVRTYYAYVSAWCGWATTEGYLDRHHADTSTAHGPLPDDDGRRPGDQQAWAPEHRDAITEHVDRAASAAIERLADAPEDGDERLRAEYDAIRACRDRALVYALAYTAVRSAELLRDPDDERRAGVRWADLDYHDQNLTVLRKKQQYDQASVPEPALHPLRQLERVLDPPDGEWPVFPTLHYPTLAERAREGLAAAGHDEAAIAERREAGGRDLFVCREHGIRPPSLTPNAARRVMQRLCADAGIELDDDHGYLAPHGGRRGMGEVLVRQFGYTAAARYLDNSEEMVRRRYSHITAAERADMATEALAATDRRVRDDDE